MAQTKSISSKMPSPEPGNPASPNGQPKVPQRLQRAKVADAMRMVEREWVIVFSICFLNPRLMISRSAVIDAITSRLERLNTSLWSSYSCSLPDGSRFNPCHFALITALNVIEQLGPQALCLHYLSRLPFLGWHDLILCISCVFCAYTASNDRSVNVLRFFTAGISHKHYFCCNPWSVL